MGLVIFILQAAVATAPVAQSEPAIGDKPTIELHAHLRAKSIRIETSGSSRVDLHAEPLLDQHWTVDRSAPIPVGKTVANPRITLDAAVTVDPSARIAAQATATPKTTPSKGSPTP